MDALKVASPKTGAPTRCQSSSKPDLLDLVDRDLVVRAVVELGGAWAGVRGHLLGLFQCAVVGQVVGDAGGAEAMAADLGLDAGRLGTAAGHPPAVGGADRVPGRFTLVSGVQPA